MICTPKFPCIQSRASAPVTLLAMAGIFFDQNEKLMILQIYGTIFKTPIENKKACDGGKMTVKMMIRKAKEKDIPRILELLEQVLQIHAGIRPDIFIPGTTKYTADELAELLKNKEKPIYVAVNGRIFALDMRFANCGRSLFQTIWYHLSPFLLMIYVSIRRHEASILEKVCLHI